LRRWGGLEVFVPRIRFRRNTRKSVVWVTEALFPSYLFARFDWASALRQVYHSPGVNEVVHFGSHWPVIPDEAIEALRAALGKNEIHVIPADVAPGDTVKIAGGSFHGLCAVVARVLPSAKRVAVLLDFLGGQTAVELDLGMVIKETDEREAILRGSRRRPNT
jgi:transcriptional antiterminator RfaH